MLVQKPVFTESQVLGKIAHYLPSQAPLKDFVHHNTLHAFQHLNFHDAMKLASTVFGYHTYQQLSEYRTKFEQNEIPVSILDAVIVNHKGNEALEVWKERMLFKTFNTEILGRIGKVRAKWKEDYFINLDKEVHPLLFRVIGSYLDQGIAIWQFPKGNDGFLAAVRQLEAESFVSLFHGKTAPELLKKSDLAIEYLLKRIVGDPAYYEHYLFDMLFAHPGWSGMVSVVEHQPETLLDHRKISLRELVIFELLLEFDALEHKKGKHFQPLSNALVGVEPDLFMDEDRTELDEVLKLWQEAFEWSFFDPVLKGLISGNTVPKVEMKRFQAVFCIDDRESSLRTYLELADNTIETFGTAGFFNMAFYYQPEHSFFHTKVCPGPMQPNHLIREREAKLRHSKDALFHKSNHGFISGWMTAQTIGLWSAIKMTRSIFMPAESPAMVSSFNHMDPEGKLSIAAEDQNESDLQTGFTLPEMVERLEGLLKSIGLTNDFAAIVYLIGHGASSVNNTYYAGYDCGACSGRAGSVNARVAANIANRKEVREGLRAIGIDIPDATRFIAGLHDTTRDEIQFYDTGELSDPDRELHNSNVQVFKKTLQRNAQERARRFVQIDNTNHPDLVHEKVKLRALSLFEPRPEWNHATNALCIVGRRESNKHLFLDRRAFLQSYDYRLDSDGSLLLGILKAVAPVCGGINLEYYFSKVDNTRLGAGSKLPHNVMGLIGVVNGIEGDLRTGLPEQMINIHDPLRLMVTVEHYPEVVTSIIRRDESIFEWFSNEWVILVTVHPENGKLYRFANDEFRQYRPLNEDLPVTDNLTKLVCSTKENIPVHLIKRGNYGN